MNASFDGKNPVLLSSNDMLRHKVRGGIVCRLDRSLPNDVSLPIVAFLSSEWQTGLTFAIPGVTQKVWTPDKVMAYFQYRKTHSELIGIGRRAMIDLGLTYVAPTKGNQPTDREVDETIRTQSSELFDMRTRVASLLTECKTHPSYNALKVELYTMDVSRMREVVDMLTAYQKASEPIG